jgi:hypothetical protein
MREFDITFMIDVVNTHGSCFYLNERAKSDHRFQNSNDFTVSISGSIICFYLN